MLEMSTVQVVSFIGLSFAGALFGLALKRMQKEMKEQRDMLDERHVRLVEILGGHVRTGVRTMDRVKEIETRLRIPAKKGTDQ